MSLIVLARQAIPFRKEDYVDHKAWAKRILWRLERKDPELTPIQITFAKQALDIKEEEPK